MGKFEKGPAEDILSVCKKFFFGGFLFLPILWLINFVYMYPIIRARNDLSHDVRKYAFLSLAGAVLWLLILITWGIIFETQRDVWGVRGDMLSVVIPKGR
ncbi:hypothetical protein M427DRAFT_330319 [Gonapodya prolifera JEL478]|uniref:Gamma-secretase subunit PEN-2 n=1 Tax=Gonapodya prolifera (strain JEL478) TaxID=1344416 RepID=A0A139AEB3_GONPJ|nr:hypothetical protein M427DRAFT_330319 [Gonapodya prolifera JEL478]|eukprot:KXS15131.1 hypothetical protein M427DRAFT_330319 [Gonapodya prolifera JEL478]